MRRFLDQLPRMIATKAEPVRQFDDPRRQLLVARALEAALYQRQATLTYHSKASERTKTYRVHPYRLAYAAGALYLLAYVPEYGEIRTFALGLGFGHVESGPLVRSSYHADEHVPAKQ